MMNHQKNPPLKRFWVLVFMLAETSLFAKCAIKTDPEALWRGLDVKVVQAYQQGKYAEGTLDSQEAYQFAKTHFGKEHPNTLTSMNNLAKLYQREGRYGEVEPLYKEALQLMEKVLGKEHPNTLSSMNSLAGLYESQGRYGEAESLYKEALQLMEKVLGKEHQGALASMNNLAGLYLSQGRYVDAEPLSKEALQLSEKVLGKEHPVTLASMNNLALLYQSQGRYGDAEPLCKEALQGCESFAQKYPETSHIRFAADVALKWKQIYAEEHAFQHRVLWFSEDPDMKRLKTDMARLRSLFSRKIHQKENRGELFQVMVDLNRAEGELRDKTRILKPELLASGVNTDRLTGKLPGKSALIEFRRFNLKNFKTGKIISQNWAAYLLLSDINAEQRLFFENLGSIDDLKKILNTSRDPMLGLYQMLFSKFENHLKNVETLYLAPDGFLNILPFAALKTANGRYLAERFTLRQLQTGRDLMEAPSGKPANTLIALGGVDYGELPGRKKEKSLPDDVKKILETMNPNLRADKELDGGLPYLKQSLDEIEAIEKVFKRNCKDGNTLIFKESQAAEAILKTLTAAPRILHLSTHGFYLQKAEASPLAEMEPMVLSGLALAGANLGLKGILDENGDDGLLYSLEVLGLKLQGAELVSLSACETGKGVMDYSEGVYGLIRAFRTAGARHVLMTLSSVGDKASKEFMIKFYEIWLSGPEGASPADALNQTRLHFIGHENPTYRDPAYWSPYVMVGI